jgi:hypothetical protein
MAGITESSLFPEGRGLAAEIRAYLRVFAGLFSANQKWIIYFWIVSRLLAAAIALQQVLVP